MTATMPAQAQARYRGVVYGIDVLDHASVMAGTPVIVPNDYVGKTRQRGRLRENQHRDTQPFSDLIVGSPRVLWEGICTEDELDEVERRFIQDDVRRPRMNEKLNEDNPAMISKGVQVAERHQRDDARGEPRWVRPQFRNRQSLLEWEPTGPMHSVSDRPVSVPRKWTAVQVNTLVWSGVWVSTTGITWGVLDRSDLFGSWVQRLVFAAVSTLLMIVWGLAGAPITRAQRRKLKRRLRKWMNSRTRRSRRR